MTRKSARGSSIAHLGGTLFAPCANRAKGVSLNFHKEIGTMKALVARFVREESGQDLIEYGLLVGIITSVAVLTIKSLGSIVEGFYTNLQTNLTQ